MYNISIKVGNRIASSILEKENLTEEQIQLEGMVILFPHIQDKLRKDEKGKYILPKIEYSIITTEAKETPIRIFEKNLIQAVGKLLDDTAKEHGYDSILSLCSYAMSINPQFGSEGRQAMLWRDSVWVKSYEIIERASKEDFLPTIDEALKELPQMIWPK